jgi:hypothetical protein
VDSPEPLHPAKPFRLHKSTSPTIFRLYWASIETADCRRRCRSNGCFDAAVLV